jgi:uncharacterized protein (TIGR01777 family)
MKKIIIAGGSGLIGQRLATLLLENGFDVGILTRSPKTNSPFRQILWNPEKDEVDSQVLMYDYLVNLAGVGIADKPWTRKRKKEIIESRVNGINLICQKILNSKKSMKAVVSASAIGFYGNSEKLVTEDTKPQSNDFLVDVCNQWESTAKNFEKITSNLYIIRIGTVLSQSGGALSKMALTVKYGLGNYLGNGKQWMSWIHIDDICGQIIHLLGLEDNGGVYNGVSPEPVQNKEFTKALINTINKKSILLPAPKFLIRAILGEMATLILNSNKVSSKKIEEVGYNFKFDTLEKALTDIYPKKRP